MFGSFTSSQYVETVGDDGKEIEFKIEVNCVSRGLPECQYQRNGDPGWPAEGAEFEINSVHVVDDSGKHSYEITQAAFEAITGEDASYRMYDAAYLEAQESGEFDGS